MVVTSVEELYFVQWVNTRLGSRPSDAVMRVLLEKFKAGELIIISFDPMKDSNASIEFV